MGQGTAGSGGSHAGSADTAGSLDGSSHLLNELAGMLHAGRMVAENATLCLAPRSHPEVSEVVAEFAEYAQRQYDDMVTLLAGLSTKLRSTSDAYVTADEEVQRELNALLDDGQYVAPENR